MGSKNRLVGTRFRPTFYGHNPGAQQELSQALPRPRAKTWVIFIRLTSNLHHLIDLGEYFTRNRARGDAFFDHFLWPQSGRAAGGAKSAPTAQGKNMGNMHPFELNHAWFKRSRTGLHPRFFQRGTTSGGFRARFSLGGRLLGTFLAGRPWGRRVLQNRPWGRVLGPFLWPQSGRAAGGAKSAPTAQGKNMGNMHPFELHAWFKRRDCIGVFSARDDLGRLPGTFFPGRAAAGPFLAGRPWGRNMRRLGKRPTFYGHNPGAQQELSQASTAEGTSPEIGPVGTRFLTTFCGHNPGAQQAAQSGPGRRALPTAQAQKHG